VEVAVLVDIEVDHQIIEATINRVAMVRGAATTITIQELHPNISRMIDMHQEEVMISSDQLTIIG
jgi:hypothetical protein